MVYEQVVRSLLLVVGVVRCCVGISGSRTILLWWCRLVRPSSLHPHLLEGDGVCLKLLSCLVGQLTCLTGGGGALDGAEAAVRARGGEVSGGHRSRSGGSIVVEVRLLYRRAAVRLSVAEIVGGGEVELGGRRSRGGGRIPRVGRRGQAWRAGLRAGRGRRRGLLEVGEPAGLGAVGITVCLDLLVTGKAELVVPEIEGHDGGGCVL